MMVFDSQHGVEPDFLFITFSVPTQSKSSFGDNQCSSQAGTDSYNVDS